MRLLDERTYAFQWDSNIYVVLPKANVGDEVHFAHRKDKKSLVVIAKEIDSTVVAMVPNLLLQKAGFIQIYHFITDEKGNRTVNREELKVLEKEKPDDYLYEESQVLSWEYLDKRITALEKGGAGSGGIGTETTVGGVKSSNDPNKIKILEDGTMEVNPISFEKAVSIGTGAATISSGEKLVLTPTTNTASISDYYIPLKATATANTTGATGSISGSATASISSAGYAVKDRTASGPISGTAIAKTTTKDSSDYYIPVAKAAYSSALPTGMVETDFTDISSSAPALVSGGYLYIKEGYNKNQKISLAKLVPDKGTIVGSSSDAIVSGESAYNNDGVLVSGSLAKASLSGALHANQTTTAGYDFYNISMSRGHNRNGDVAAVQIPVYQGDWVV